MSTMTIDGNFEEASNEARLMEKKVVEYAPYTGKVEISNALDLEPKDYIGLNYADMLNLYERTQKIISASGMEVYRQGGLVAPVSGPIAPSKTELSAAAPSMPTTAPPSVAPKEELKKEPIEEMHKEIELDFEPEAPTTAPPALTPSAETKEVEDKLRRMSSEAIAQAEEVSKTQAPEVRAATTDELGIEIEHGYNAPAPFEMEKEKTARKSEMELDLKLPPQIPPPQQLDLERERERLIGAPQSKQEEKGWGKEREKEIIRAPEVEVPSAPTAPSAPPVPPALRESADEAAAKRYSQIEEQVKAALGSGTDEITLKKRMLELTKELFNKNTGQNRREAIKHEIAVLKNMLSWRVASVTPTPSSASRPSKPIPGASAAMFGTLISSQESELSAAKDKIIDARMGEIEEIKKQFHNELAEAENAASKKRIFDKFVTNVTEVVKRLPEETDSQKQYLEEKHSAEIKKVLETSADNSVNAKVDERLRTIKEGYGPEFTKVKAIIAKDIDGIIDAASLEIFEEEEKKEVAEPPKPEAIEIASEEPEPEVVEKEEIAKPKKGKNAAAAPMEEVVPAAPTVPAATKKAASAGGLVSAMKNRRTISEINAMDESTLLLFLKNQDAAYYKKYQTKKVSKAETILQAKRLMAKDRGLGDEVIKKFF